MPKLSDFITRVVSLLILVAVVGLVAGQALGQPILLSYVETESMEPTLNSGDGFVALPTEITGQIEEGDVIVFRAEELHGGGLVTHRVVGTADSGYRTKGDANSDIDQKIGEPLVKETKVVAVALQVNGHVVTVPHLGMFVNGVQTAMERVNFVLERLFGLDARITTERLPYVFFILSLSVYIIGELRDRNSKNTKRERSRDAGTDVRLIIALMTGVIVISATGMMVITSGPQEYSLIASKADTPALVPLGERTSRTHSMVNSGKVPVLIFLEPGSNQTNVTPQEVYLEPGELANATATLQAPLETGHYRYYVIERRYLALLPKTTIHTLYEIHPWLPIIVIDLLIGVPFYLLGVRLVGTGRIRSRSRDGPSRLGRLWRRYL